jgi:hypothetical protein
METPKLRSTFFSEEKQTFESGATSSKLPYRFDLICPRAMQRIAIRYMLGALKHGDMNWCKGIPMHERLNHLEHHLQMHKLYGSKDAEGNPEDNLAAIAWNAIALMHYEDGCKHHEMEMWERDGISIKPKTSKEESTHLHSITWGCFKCKKPLKCGEYIMQSSTGLVYCSIACAQTTEGIKKVCTIDPAGCIDPISPDSPEYKDALKILSEALPK